MNWAMATPEKVKPGPKHEDIDGYTCITSLEKRKKKGLQAGLSLIDQALARQ